jgi:hypothetical protein
MATPHVAAATALCVATAAGAGPCASDTNAASLVTMLRSTNSAYGFSGDPFRPVSGRYYGCTAVAGTPSEAPGFTLTASPTSRSIVRGQSTTYTITVNRTNGFASPVSLSVSGLPSRSTASFSRNPGAASTSTSRSRPARGRSPGRAR